MAAIADKRVRFDFEVDFSNGGGIQGQGFRLDIPRDEISDAELADYIVRDMRLLMVKAVRIVGKEIITEAHKRTRTLPRARRFFDISHVVEEGMVTYRGFPAPVICDYLSREASRAMYAPGVEFQIGKIEMVSNTGTYLDSPFHRYASGADVSQLALDRLADVPAVIVSAPSGRERAADRDAFRGVDCAGKAVLVRTGWDKHWRTDKYFEGFPFLTGDAARFLADRGAAIVGIDSLNIDSTDDPRRPVHSTLLGAGIPIVEHLRGLDQLPASGARFSAVPVKVRACGTFPVRAYATIDES